MNLFNEEDNIDKHLLRYFSEENININKKIPNSFSSFTNSPKRKNKKVDIQNYKLNSLKLITTTSSLNFPLSSTAYNSQENSPSNSRIKLSNNNSNYFKNRNINYSPMNKISFIERKKIRSMTNLKNGNLFLDENNGVHYKKIEEKIMNLMGNRKLSIFTKSIYSFIPHKVKFSLERKNMKLDNLKDLFNKDKKIKSKDKYHPIKNSFKVLNHVSILNKKEKIKENFYKKFLQIKKGNNYLKRLIRLKILKNLWVQNTLLMEKFILYYDTSKWFFIENHYWSHKKFQEFTNVSNLRADDDFVEQLFLIFSFESQNKKIDIIQVLIYFILTTNKNNKTKIKDIINLFCDTEKENNRKKNLITIKRIIHIFHQIFNPYFNSDLMIHFEEKLKMKFNKETLDKNVLLDEIENYPIIEKGLTFFYNLYLNIDKTLSTHFKNLLSVYNRKALELYDTNMHGENYYAYFLMDKILNSIENKIQIVNKLKSEQLKEKTDFDKVYFEKTNINKKNLTNKSNFN